MAFVARRPKGRERGLLEGYDVTRAIHVTRPFAAGDRSVHKKATGGSARVGLSTWQYLATVMNCSARRHVASWDGEKTTTPFLGIPLFRMGTYFVVLQQPMTAFLSKRIFNLLTHGTKGGIKIESLYHCPSDAKVTAGGGVAREDSGTGAWVHSERRGRIATAQYFVETTACAV